MLGRGPTCHSSLGPQELKKWIQSSVRQKSRRKKKERKETETVQMRKQHDTRLNPLKIKLGTQKEAT